jgi:hypothetical protein
MVSSLNESLCIANGNVQPAQQTRIRIVHFRLMSVVLECSFVATVTTTPDNATGEDLLLCKVAHGSLADILCDFHLQKQQVFFIQRQGDKYLSLFCAAPALLTYRWTAEKSVIELHNTIELVRIVPLPHGLPDSRKNIPCCFIGHTNR